MSWKNVKIGKVLKQYRIEHWVQNDKSYKQVSILNDGSVVLRGEKIGKEIGRKRQFIINLEKYPNTLIFTRQLLLQGSIGMASKEVNGCIVTENMPMFSVEGIRPEFLFFFIKSELFKAQVRNLKTSGTAQKSLHERQFLELEIPLPTDKEQKEIVEKCKLYETNFNNLVKEIELQETYLQLLRQTILQEAVQGELTKQDATDEPAKELLKRIKAEKQKLLKAGKLKKEKELPPITEDEIPFKLPEGWVWCILKELGFITGGGTPSTNKSEYWNGNIPWITPKDMKADYLNDSEDKVTIEGVNNSSAKLIPANSVLVVGRSGILKRILPVCINKVECTVNQDLKVLVPHLSEMARYIQLMLQGHQEFILKDLVKYGMTVHSLMYQEFEMQVFPLPPLLEQQRIVAKVQQLQEQLSQLETQVQKSRKYAQHLLQSVLREAFEEKGKVYKMEKEVLNIVAEEEKSI